MVERYWPEQRVRLFVDGKEMESVDRKMIGGVNPSNGRVEREIPQGSVEDVEKAVESAALSFRLGGWSARGPVYRKDILLKFADLIERDADQLDRLDALDMGKPISERTCNARVAAELLRTNAECADKLVGATFSSGAGSSISERWVPRGVVAAVTPWNFPTYNAILKIGPALVAGNSVILKPSENSSHSAFRLAQLAIEAGLPEGTLNMVPGKGGIVGEALSLHSDVAMVAFTGSTRTGKRVFANAGISNLKSVMLECGGKCPQIVFDDGVNLDMAAANIARSILLNQGQVCSSGSRLLVKRGIEDLVIKKILKHFSEVTIGAAVDPKTNFGPIASLGQCERILSLIAAGKAGGAELVFGGKRSDQDSDGYFVEPTLFRNVAADSLLAQEEIFGPVLAISAFDEIGEAIQLANSTAYGLLSYAWTNNLTTAMRLTDGIRSSVLIHAGSSNAENAGHILPFEPAGMSGVGVEGGMAGLTSYMRRQLVWMMC